MRCGRGLAPKATRRDTAQADHAGAEQREGRRLVAAGPHCGFVHRLLSSVAAPLRAACYSCCNGQPAARPLATRLQPACQTSAPRRCRTPRRRRLVTPKMAKAKKAGEHSSTKPPKRLACSRGSAIPRSPQRSGRFADHTEEATRNKRAQGLGHHRSQGVAALDAPRQGAQGDRGMALNRRNYGRCPGAVTAAPMASARPRNCPCARAPRARAEGIKGAPRKSA